MTAPLFFLPEHALAQAATGTQLLLDGPEGRHAATVRRLGVGEAVLLADGSGRVADSEVIEVRPHALLLAVTDVRREPAAQPRLVLVQALAKDGRDLQAIEAATELGVDEVLPWQADRSVVQWRGDRAAKSKAKWENTIRAAAKQSRRASVPAVGELLSRSALIGLVRGGAVTLVLHEEAEDSPADVDLPQQGDVHVVVGPEGGITPEELDALRAAGAQCIRLGPTVLRSSTAGPAALAVLASRLRW